MTAPTLDQHRARHAWDAVQRARELEEREQNDYGREAKKLPMRIHAAGLGHALAFLHAKGKTKALIDDITDWVMKKRRLPGAASGCLIESIVKGDALFLRLATEETLAYLAWLVRFAEAEGLTKDTESET